MAAEVYCSLAGDASPANKRATTATRRHRRRPGQGHYCSAVSGNGAVTKYNTYVQHVSAGLGSEFGIQTIGKLWIGHWSEAAVTRSTWIEVLFWFNLSLTERDVVACRYYKQLRVQFRVDRIRVRKRNSPPQMRAVDGGRRNEQTASAPRARA